MQCDEDAGHERWWVIMLIVNVVALLVGLAAQSAIHHWAGRFSFAQLLRPIQAPDGDAPQREPSSPRLVTRRAS